MDVLRLTVPATAAFVPMVRSAVAWSGSFMGFRVDELDDMRLAAGEACAYLLKLAPGAETLTLDVDPVTGAFSLLARTRKPEGRALPQDGEGFVSWHILGALADDVALRWTREGPCIGFRRRTAQTEAV